jgi:histidyl-tRNA synthetase
MEELQLFPKNAQISSKVLICHFDDATLQYGLGVLARLRAAGIPAEIYPDQKKLNKQLEYANKKMIPFTLVIGSDEMQSGQLAFKDMEKGEQVKATVDEVIARLR